MSRVLRTAVARSNQVPKQSCGQSMRSDPNRWHCLRTLGIFDDIKPTHLDL